MIYGKHKNDPRFCPQGRRHSKYHVGCHLTKTINTTPYYYPKYEIWAIEHFLRDYPFKQMDGKVAWSFDWFWR